MILVDSVVGNLNDPAWRDRVDGAQLDVLRLDQWQAQKNRFRRKTEGGAELAVSLERNTHLRDGDLLLWDAEARSGVVARITLQEVMVIRLDHLIAKDPALVVRTCVELGHALGNQHWPAVVKGNAVYVPLTVDRKVMASVMRTHAFEGIACEFVPGAEVIPYLAPHEIRRLFGGADSTPHTHTHGHDHGHDHAHDHDHAHHHHHH